MRKIILSIEGMTCSACSNGLEKYLNKLRKEENSNVYLALLSRFINKYKNLMMSMNHIFQIN